MAERAVLVTGEARGLDAAAALALAPRGGAVAVADLDLEAFKRERTARIPLGRRSDPVEMAASIVWLALDAPPYMTAARLNVTGGLDRD